MIKKKALYVKSSVTINGTAAQVWDALTNPEQTKKYMFGCETVSDWKVGSALLWKMEYEGKELIAVKGNIVEIKPNEILSYTTIDPESEVEDIPENYLTVRYQLNREKDHILLVVSQGDYSLVADGKQRYEEAYNDGEGWNPILIEIKKLVESM